MPKLMLAEEKERLLSELAKIRAQCTDLQRVLASDRLIRAGSALATCAYNVAQYGELDEPTSGSLKMHQLEWDAALDEALKLGAAR